jgi:hypothetical protein
MAHADLHLGLRVRFFVQIKSGLENGREGGPRLFDEDQLDPHQAFLDVALHATPERSLTLRVGRQELAYGATRFISAREGPTVRQTFEGIKLILRSGAWRVDGFATSFVRTKPGTFDDDPEPGRNLWGVYAVRAVSFLPGGNVDLYYLGAHRDVSRFDQGAGDERRHSIGTRVWGKHEPWDYDVEPIVQWGSFAQGDIRAWAVETDTGYTLRSVRTTPRIGFKVHAASGDQDPTDPDLETFNPLYPRGLYNQLVNLHGHVNLIELQPSLTIRPTKRWTVTLDWSLVKRESLDDGVYGVGGNLLRPAGGSRARPVGSQLSLVPIWRVNRHITFVWIATHFFPGRFLEETGSAEPVTHLSGWFAYKL